MEPFKNVFNKDFVSLLSSSIKNNYVDFDQKQFILSVFDEDFEARELKQRMRHISQCLKTSLPQDFVLASNILVAIADRLSGLANMVLPDFIEVYGLEHYDQSIKALEEFTKYGSSEFAVRPFLIRYPDEMMNQMLVWSKSSNEHVRRLASEGSRPRLPWAMALPHLKSCPNSLTAILEQLKDDASEYVRRSVANNINDISKDNPNYVLDLLEAWVGHSKNRDWLIKHASRTLLKSGDSRALALFGYSDVSRVELKDFYVDSKVKLGDKISFSFEILSKKDLGKLRLEFAIYFQKKNKKLSKKVFKISESDCKTKSKKVDKYFSFRQITTRVYYLGQHELSIIVNGKEFPKKEFLLT